MDMNRWARPPPPEKNQQVEKINFYEMYISWSISSSYFCYPSPCRALAANSIEEAHVSRVELCADITNMKLQVSS